MIGARDTSRGDGKDCPRAVNIWPRSGLDNFLLILIKDLSSYDNRREIGNGVAKDHIEWARSQRNKPTTRCSQCRREIEHYASCSSVSLPDLIRYLQFNLGTDQVFLPFSAVIYKLLGFTLAMIVAPIGTYYLTLNTIFRGLSVLFKLSLFSTSLWLKN